MVQDETARTDLDWPVLDPGSGWTIENTVAWSYYLFLVLPVAATLVAGWRRRYARAPESELPKVLATAVAGMVANYCLLRGNLEARLADPAVLHAVTGAWLLNVVWSGFMRQTLGRPLRTAAAVTMTAVMVVSAATLGTVGSLPQEILTSRFTEGVSATFERTGRIWNLLAALPPTDWGDEGLTDGYMAAAAYLSRCTPPVARILNATYATDHLVFARRGFAAGQVNFVPGFYSSPDDQRNAVARARRQAPPVVITDLLETLRRRFHARFPHRPRVPPRTIRRGGHDSGPRRAVSPRARRAQPAPNRYLQGYGTAVLPLGEGMHPPTSVQASGLRVAIVQSNYLPWKGYFDLIAASDVFVLYDDVQYTRRDWRNRNKIKTAHGLHWLTIPREGKGAVSAADPRGCHRRSVLGGVPLADDRPRVPQRAGV